jgi:hypothetical protein
VGVGDRRRDVGEHAPGGDLQLIRAERTGTAQQPVLGRGHHVGGHPCPQLTECGADHQGLIGRHGTGCDRRADGGELIGDLGEPQQLPGTATGQVQRIAQPGLGGAVTGLGREATPGRLARQPGRERAQRRDQTVHPAQHRHQLAVGQSEQGTRTERRHQRLQLVQRLLHATSFAHPYDNSSDQCRWAHGIRNAGHPHSRSIRYAVRLR